jgi:hypothetical protein
MGNGLQQETRLLSRECHRFMTLDLRKSPLKNVRRIARQQLLFDGASES